MSDLLRPMVGKFFHTFTRTGVLQYQGKVLLAGVRGGYKVALFSFLDGEANGTKVLSTEMMMRSQTYSTATQMRRAYEEIGKLAKAKGE